MQRFVQFLKDNPVQYVATLGIDGKPKVRPFMFAGFFQGKLWFSTSSNKAIYRELNYNPAIEVCVADNYFNWVRLSALAVFEDNYIVKQECFNNNEAVRRAYGNVSNPVFQVFYLDKVKAVMFELEGGKTYEYPN